MARRCRCPGSPWTSTWSGRPSGRGRSAASVRAMVAWSSCDSHGQRVRLASRARSRPPCPGRVRPERVVQRAHPRRPRSAACATAGPRRDQRAARPASTPPGARGSCAPPNSRGAERQAVGRELGHQRSAADRHHAQVEGHVRAAAADLLLEAVGQARAGRAGRACPRPAGTGSGAGARAGRWQPAVARRRPAPAAGCRRQPRPGRPGRPCARRWPSGRPGRGRPVGGDVGGAPWSPRWRCPRPGRPSRRPGGRRHGRTRAGRRRSRRAGGSRRPASAAEGSPADGSPRRAPGARLDPESAGSAAAPVPPVARRARARQYWTTLWMS